MTAGHVITIEQVRGPTGTVWHQAVCACTWISHRHALVGRAEAAGRAHVRQPHGSFKAAGDIAAVAAYQDILSAVEDCP